MDRGLSDNAQIPVLTLPFELLRPIFAFLGDPSRYLVVCRAFYEAAYPRLLDDYHR